MIAIQGNGSGNGGRGGGACDGGRGLPADADPEAGNDGDAEDECEGIAQRVPACGPVRCVWRAQLPTRSSWMSHFSPALTMTTVLVLDTFRPPDS